MLKTVGAATIAISVGLAGTAMAQPVRAPVPADPAGVLLIKHDKEDNGRGRKLGHYKHRGRDSDDDADDEDRTRRSSTRSSRWTGAPVWVDPAPVPYYAPPAYGNSYAPAPYDYPPPAYYRGY